MRITIEYSDAALDELRQEVGLKKALDNLMPEHRATDLLALAVCAAAERQKDCVITIPVTAEYGKRVAAAKEKPDADTD
jgi:hypothetical protein